MNGERATFFAFTWPQSTGGHARIVNRTTLDLIKALRARGTAVVIEPDDGTPLHYIVQKGELAFLSDPTFAFLVGIPVGVVVNLFSSWLYDRLQRRGAKHDQPSCIVIRIDEPDRTIFCSHTGAALSRGHAEHVFELLKSTAETMTAVRLAHAAGDGRFPVCVEHTAQIVGWAELSEDSRGLKAKTEIQDEETWRRLHSGELRGASIAGIATQSECSICKKDYSECPHIAGVIYAGQVCVNTIKQLDLSEVSLVQEPINQECLIGLSFTRNA